MRLRASRGKGDGAMVTISQGQAATGGWHVRRGQAMWFSNPRLTVAVKLAREWARAQHGLPGHPVRVDMVGNRLTRHGRGDSSRAAVALAS
jgi:hypothetical protein